MEHLAETFRDLNREEETAFVFSDAVFALRLGGIAAIKAST